MKTLKTQFNKFDKIEKATVIFGITVILPMVITILVDVIQNGSNL